MNTPSKSLQRLAWISLLLSVFLGVLSSRWATVYHFGSDIPEWDEWDAEAQHTFIPYEQGHGLAQGLWRPQNEHRVPLTKAFTLGIFVANGQWDQRLEATCNAGLAALLALGLLIWGRRAIPPLFLPSFALLVACCWALPLAWQNVMAGFHSQQFFLIGLAFLTIALLPDSRPLSLRWFTALGAAVLGLGTLGSGLVAPGVVAGMLILRVIKKEVSPREIWPTLLASLAVVVLGFCIRGPIPAEDPLRAHSVQEFMLTLMKALSWPSPYGPWSFILLWAPWVWLGGGWLLRARASEADRTSLALLGFGTWVLLQCVAAAYMRGAGAQEPASRYIDTLLLGSVTNVLCLAWLFRQQRNRLTGAGIAALSLLWLGLFCMGSLRNAGDILRGDLPNLVPYYRSCERSVRNYLLTGERDRLLEGRIPYPNVDVLKERLDTPLLRKAMPASSRVPFQFLEGTGDAFVRFPADKTPAKPTSGQNTGLPEDIPPFGTEPTWGSFNKEGGAGHGTWTSKPLQAPSAWMRFEVAGTFDDPGISLEIRDAATGVTLSRIRPENPYDKGWQPAFVRAPAAPFVLVAEDRSSTGWLAFSSPTAQSRGSQAALLAGSRAPLLMTLSLGLFLLGTMLWSVGEVRRAARS